MISSLRYAGYALVGFLGMCAGIVLFALVWAGLGLNEGAASLLQIATMGALLLLIAALLGVCLWLAQARRGPAQRPLQ